MELTEEDKRTLVRIARNAIRRAVNGYGSASASDAEDCGQQPGTCSQRLSETLSARRGAFVTLTLGDQLRGCIGNVEPDTPLAETVAAVAAQAAGEDPRFPPVTPEELHRLDFEVSVLSPFRVLESIEEFRLGIDGLMLLHGYRKGLLLPQVGRRTGMTREVFLEALCKKAQISTAALQDPDTTLYAFTAEVIENREYGSQHV